LKPTQAEEDKPANDSSTALIVRDNMKDLMPDVGKPTHNEDPYDRTRKREYNHKPSQNEIDISLGFIG
jgi:hypothetical protein